MVSPLLAFEKIVKPDYNRQLVISSAGVKYVANFDDREQEIGLHVFKIKVETMTNKTIFLT